MKQERYDLNKKSKHCAFIGKFELFPLGAQRENGIRISSYCHTATLARATGYPGPFISLNKP
jgi:hypothetical protein